MEFTVEQRPFATELGLAQRMVSTKATIPVLQNVLIEARQGRIYLTATDLDKSLQTYCRARVAKEGDITIPIKRLHDYVRRLPDASVRVSVSGSDTAHLSCGRAKTRIAGQGRKTFPELAEFPEESSKVRTETLKEALRRTVISIADEQSHYTLAGAKFILKPDRITIVSTDGHRLSLYSQGRGVVKGALEFESLMAKKAMVELGNVLALSLQEHAESHASEGSKEDSGPGEPDEPPMTEIAENDNNLFFRHGERVFSCRKLSGKFPDHTRVMPRDMPIDISLESSVIKPVLERVALFADERSFPVKFELEDGRLEMKAHDRNSGSSSEESIPVDYEGDPLGIGFNARYLIEFLGICESEIVHLRLRDARAAAQMDVPGMGEGQEIDYRYVLMPIRI